MEDSEAKGPRPPKPRSTATALRLDGSRLTDDEAERRADDEAAEAKAERDRIKKMHKGSTTTIHLDPSPIEPSKKRRYEPSRQY